MADFGLYGNFPGEATPETYRRGLVRGPLARASETWAIASAIVPGGSVPFSITWAEIARDGAWARRILAELGIGAGDFCFLTLKDSQSFAFWPFQHGLFDAGARFATGMPTPWDAYRLEMYLRLFRLKLAFGLAPATLDALAAQGHAIGTLFRSAETLVALPGAWERLRDEGFSPWRVTWAGPILAIDPCDGTGARFDAAQWRLEAEAGEILISSREGRTTPFVRVPTGIRGEIGEVGGEPRLFTA